MFEDFLIIFVYSFSFGRLIPFQSADDVFLAVSELLCHFSVLLIFLNQTRVHIVDPHILLMLFLDFFVVLLADELHFFDSVEMPFLLLPIELLDPFLDGLLSLHERTRTCSWTSLSWVKLA